MIKVCIAGVAGRLGERIAHFVQIQEDMELSSAVGRNGSSTIGQSIEGVTVSASLDSLTEAEIFVEVAPKAGALAHAGALQKVKSPILLATTGLTPKEQKKFESLAADRPVLIAPNLSLGIAVLRTLVAEASRALEGFDIEIVEAHHRDKRDAPSGTAWALGAEAAEARGLDIHAQAVTARSGEIGARSSQEIGMQTIRGGGIVGDHRVLLVGRQEQIELSHRALSRDLFADGAVKAIRFLHERRGEPGLYEMKDVIQAR